jgi:tetratricopeptide (TPR) repeat protein
MFTGRLLHQYSFKNNSVVVVALFVLTIMAYRTVSARNEDWKNNMTLYFKDVKTASSSTRALAFCGMTLVSESQQEQDSLKREEVLRSAVSYFKRAHDIYPDFASMYEDWGGAYYLLNKPDSAEILWNRLKILRPDSKFIPENDERIAKYYYNKFNALCAEAQKKNDYAMMLLYYKEAVSHYDKMPEAWIYLGQIYRLNNKPDSAVMSWKKCLELQPGNEQAIGFIKNYSR